MKKAPSQKEDFVVVGCDGTSVNAGVKPLQRVVCLLHFNQLPFRHLFEKINGPATGPQTYTETIGKSLKNCETRKIVKFKRISTAETLPISDPSTLSKDQHYMYQCYEAIKSGIYSEIYPRCFKFIEVAVNDKQNTALLHVNEDTFDKFENNGYVSHEGLCTILV
ncbi:hypothetical protein TKK_0013529 [Trichogramma kaykai]